MTKKYATVTPEIAEQLCGICGSRNVIFNSPEEMEPFSKDEIPGKHYRSMPELVIAPGNAKEISAILQLANRENIPVTPRGAGSGLSGGAVPLFGGIVMRTDRLNHILEFDKANMMITVEPGVIANDINEYIKDDGLFYAGYPMSMETCFIGGNVGENAGGGKAVKYGVTARYVLGLEVVLPSGQIVQVGGKLLKDVTGYNMVPLFLGSEGTLGIFTKIILKLIPRPKYQVDLLCLFATSTDAIAAVPKILVGSGITPTSIEFMDRASIKKSCEYLNESLPWQECGAMLLISVDGFERDEVEKNYELIGQFCQKNGALEVYVADTKANSERIWKIRRGIPEAYTLANKLQSGEDVVVPPAAIPEVVIEFEKLAIKYGVQIPCYGHAGDGNLHARITPPQDWSEEKWYHDLPGILHELYAVVQSVGGRISGEHGIGHKRKPYMKCVVSEEYIEMLRTVKRAFDPNYILNPGKIFDLE